MHIKISFYISKKNSTSSLFNETFFKKNLYGVQINTKYIVTICGCQTEEHVKSSDAKASKCHLKFSSKIIIFKFSNFA